MTDRLDARSRKDLIDYNFEKAQITLREAEVLADSGFYNAAVNRLYYGVYYAASALMLSSSIESATHNGIKTMLGLKFVYPGLLEREYGQIYQRLFNSRQAGDYEDFVYYDKEQYDELAPLARKFIDRICQLVKTSA